MMMMMAVNKDTHGGFLFYFLFLSFLLMFDVNGLTEWRWSWKEKRIQTSSRLRFQRSDE